MEKFQLIIFFYFLGLIWLPLKIQAQSAIHLGIYSGPQRTYSHYIDYLSAPNKITGAWNYYNGIKITYSNNESHISMSTGVGLSRLSNNFTLKSPRMYVFSASAKIPTEKIIYKGWEVPVNLHYSLGNLEKFSFHATFGVSYITELLRYLPNDWNMQYTVAQDNQEKWTIAWEYYYNHANNSALTINSGMLINWKVNQRINASADILLQTGLIPIVTQFVKYQITSDSGNSGSLGAGYITSKGDAIKCLVGIEYKIPFKKVN